MKKVSNVKVGGPAGQKNKSSMDFGQIENEFLALCLEVPEPRAAKLRRLFWDHARAYQTPRQLSGILFKYYSFGDFWKQVDKKGKAAGFLTMKDLRAWSEIVFKAARTKFY